MILEMGHLRIVITGAPASGKTEFLERLKSRPEFADYLFFDELARSLLRENAEFRVDREKFHCEIYRRQIEREDRAKAQPFITDRGTIDAFAFHPETAIAVGTTLEKEYQRYTAIVQLGTSASLGEEFYLQDSIRRESVTEALAIEQAIRDVWQGHPCYRFIPGKRDFDEKYTCFLDLLLDLTKDYRSTV